MAHRFKLFLATFALLIASPAVASKGVVIAECRSRYLVETDLGYAILEWFGGTVPMRGDTIVGDFETYGMQTVFNLRADGDVTFWVDDYWLRRDRAYEKFYSKCR